MPVKRYFLGWDAPVTAKVREFLLPQELHGPVDMEKELIVVPTRQAGRRLRESLALYCAEQKTALLSPRVVTPTFFLLSADEQANVANQTEVATVWADVLTKTNLSEYSGLFPARTPEQSFSWAMHTSEMIQRLRDSLVDGGYRIADVYKGFSSILQEPERWQDLARLETAYLSRLEELGLQDPCNHKINRSERPGSLDEIERIVVAAVPDPTPLMIRAVEHLAEHVPIVILIHAPESLADNFDDWGRPITEKWSEPRIDIPDAEANVVLSGSPMSQSHKVLEVIAAETDRFGPADIAIGVPDRAVIPFLSADMEDKGMLTFDPAGKSLNEHPLYQLLEAFQTLVNEGTYVAFSALLRHADILYFLQKKHNLSPRWLLEELDNFHNLHLPLGWEDIARRFPLLPSSGEEPQEFRNLKKAVAFIREQVDTFENSDLDSAIRSLLQAVYEVRSVSPNKPDDEEFIAVAELIDTTLREFSAGLVTALGIEKRHALELLLHRLGDQRYSTEREGAIVDIEGWLELPWNDAPLLIITGMNDGSVPSGRLSDVFLPDSLRSQLGLRHDVDWFATDAYLMRALIESRRQEGRVCFIAGKTSSAGEPLKPSRLLFCCSDEELPHRAERLFGDPDEKRDTHPSTISFPLEAHSPADIPADRLDPVKLSVTRFKDYLACPFRFYLKHILGMEELGDERTEMDALDFGSLVHDVLQKMAQSDEMRHCENEHTLRNFLYAQTEDWATERFGISPMLQVRIQLDAAKQRLGAAACIQAELVREGWEILHSELKIESELDGMLIRGQIDRVDRHRETGLLRILDYKTSDKTIKPEEAHFSSISPDTPDFAIVSVNGKEKRWVDLQLPLYHLLLSTKEKFRGRIELGYFNLPKASNDTGVTIWESFNNELMESARACAAGVIKGVQERRFWPPAEKVQHDDFESLFHADIANCVNVEAFKSFIGEH